MSEENYLKIVRTRTESSPCPPRQGSNQCPLGLSMLFLFYTPTSLRHIFFFCQKNKLYLTTSSLSFFPHEQQVVLGSGGVGKSALTFRLITDSFVVSYDPTIEDDYRKSITIDGQVERLDILDTAGQEEYNSMRDMWYQSGEGFLLVYSITNRSTFEELNEVYKEILMAKDPVPEGGVPVVLVRTVLLCYYLDCFYYMFGCCDIVLLLGHKRSGRVVC